MSGAPPPDHPRRCTANRKRDGQRCTHWAAQGMNVCYHHGAGTPASRAASKRRVETARAEAAVARLLPKDIQPCYDPLGALSQLAGEVLAWRDVLRAQLDHLETLNLLDAVGIDRARAVVELYERALDRASHVLVAIARLDLDERLTRITEHQAELVVTLLERVLADLGLDDEAAQRVHDLVPRHLRALQAS